MRPHRTAFVVTSLTLVALVALPLASTEAVQKRSTQAQPSPPTVSLTADRTLVTICARDSSLDASRVQLRADATSPEGRTLRYKWETTGGRVEGSGATTVWDLGGAAPGRYTATVEASTVTGETGAGEPGCTAFTSAVVQVVECPPVVEVCPNISVSCPTPGAPGAPVTFSADVSGGTPGRTPGYSWTVTGGRIVGGQGTSAITVDTAGLAGGAELRATVEVEGYGPRCSDSCATSLPLPPPPPPQPKPFDEYGDISRDDEKARLDNFAAELQAEPSAQGYIVVYAAPNARPGAASKRAQYAKDYLVTTRGIDASRIVVVDGGTSSAFGVRLWIVPAGAAPPPR
ncbi:MAG: hypothetical protein ABR563_13485 [Pyrinomonadaceae bacterium]